MMPGDADRLRLLVADLAVDGLFGDMRAIFRHIDHPVVLAGRAIAFFDRTLNRETRSEVSRRGRGISRWFSWSAPRRRWGSRSNGSAVAICSVPSLKPC